MKYFLFALIALFPIKSFAHGAHIEEVAGHAHSFANIATNSLMIVILAIAFVALFVVWRNKNG